MRIARTVAFLFVGFFLVKTDAIDRLSAWVAIGLAQGSSLLLQMQGYDFTRNVAELRNLSNGYALNVTDACDGIGLFVVFVATIFGAMKEPFQLRPTVMFLALAFFAIQVFNIIRIVMLFMMMPAHSPGFETIHLYIFPLLSAVVVAGLIVVGSSFQQFFSTHTSLIWLLSLLVAASVWYFLGHTITRFTVLPLANVFIALFPGSLLDSIEAGEATSTIMTLLVQSPAPLRTVELPFYITDFTLAVPLIVASLAVSKLKRAQCFIISTAIFVSMALAMAIAAVTQTHGVVAASKIAEVVGTEGLPVAYELPVDIWRTLLTTAQDTLVYFNLLVAPFVLLLPWQTPQKPKPAKAYKTKKVKRG